MIAHTDLYSFSVHPVTHIDFRSFSVQSSHLKFGLPAFLLPAGFLRNTFFTVPSSDILTTWPASYMYANFNQQDAAQYNILYCCHSCTCFRRFPRPSSGAQKLYVQYLVFVKLICCYCLRGWDGTARRFHLNHASCTYSFWAPDDGRGNRLKHVQLWQQ